MRTTDRHVEWLDDVDFDDLHDGARLRAIGAALTRIEEAEADLQRAVADARTAGESWAAIGVVLGTSRQAAHRRFSGLLNLPEDLMRARNDDAHEMPS